MGVGLPSSCNIHTVHQTRIASWLRDAASRLLGPSNFATHNYKTTKLAPLNPCFKAFFRTPISQLLYILEIFIFIC